MDLSAVEKAILEAPLSTPEDLLSFQKNFLKKGGVLDGYYGQLRTLPAAERPAFGQALQRLRVLAEERFQAAQAHLRAAEAIRPTLSDPTFPAFTISPGGRHPLSLVESQIVHIFSRIGFTLADGPEIEDDWHNFSALNFEPDHPARDMQDTFFIDPARGLLLRTHTSTIQVRVMERQEPPIRILAPGRVYRHETISARAHVYFHQIEGPLCGGRRLRCRPQSHPGILRAGLLWAGYPCSLARLLLPLHRNERRTGYRLPNMPWERLPRLQTHRLGGSFRLRHGRP